MNENNYTVLHCHTEQSLLDSTTNHKDYANKAKELGQTAIAYTEHGNINVWVEKKMYCDSIGIKYIHGIECYLTEKLYWDNEDGTQSKRRDNYHTILLAKNYEGVKELNRLVYTSKMKDHFYYDRRITFDEFLNISDNIIKISACLASPLNKYRKTKDKTFEKLLHAYDYYEIQPHDFEEQKEYNLFLYELSQITGIPLIMGTDTHGISKYKNECRTILQYAKNIVFQNEDTFDLSYKSYDELCDMMRNQEQYLPENVWLDAIENTNKVAESVENFKLDTSFKYPPLYGDKDEKVLWDRLRTKYKEKAKKGAIVKEKAQQYAQNIKEEMRVFKKLGMCGFILFMSELISWCKENNIPVGAGRGSVNGSTVAYIGDITDVDPVVWNTMFARFCNEYRVELGDVDVDFAPDDRDKVFQYIIDRFGLEYTGYVFSNGTIKEKGVLDEVGRGLDNKWKIEHGYKIKDKVPNSPYSLKVIDKIKKEYEQNPDEARQKYPDIFYYFDGMLNVVVSESFHPAGIIASPINLIDNYGGSLNDKGQVVLPINMEECHEINLVKFDILSLVNIKIIRDACKYANIPYPQAYKINWCDENVWQDIITSPVGIFQFESKFAFESLKKFQPHKLDDMTIVTAAIRPSGESYRDRLLNHELNKNPSALIDDLLKDNNGYLCYQEDVLRFLVEICGMSGSEADNVRRAIGRKQVDRLQKALPQILEGYCNKSDKPREIAEQEAKEFLQVIEDASSYMFGRNHATAYSMIGYILGWLRYYYPLEFLTSFLNNANTDEDTLNGTELANQKGIKIKAPKFGYAHNEYMCDKESNTIYKGLGSIKDMQLIAADIMLDIADKNPETFVDVLFLTKECKINNKKINKKSLEILLNIGFFDVFGTIPELKSILYWFDKYKKCKTVKRKTLTDEWLIEIIRKNAGKESEKQFGEIDNKGIVKDIYNILPKQAEDNTALIRNQIKYLGYADIGNDNISPLEYYVQDVNEDKWGRIWLSLYQLSSGISKRYKCDKTWFKRLPCIKDDIIKAIFKSKEKMKVVGEDEDGKKIFARTGEYENIVKGYSIVK